SARAISRVASSAVQSAGRSVSVVACDTKCRSWVRTVRGLVIPTASMMSVLLDGLPARARLREAVGGRVHARDRRITDTVEHAGGARGGPAHAVEEAFELVLLDVTRQVDLDRESEGARIAHGDAGNLL